MEDFEDDDDEEFEEEELERDERSLFPISSDEDDEKDVVPRKKHVRWQDEEQFLSDNNFDEEDEDELDPAAWGKRRHIFHGGETVDEDFRSLGGTVAEAAEEEERETERLQKELMSQIDDADFSIDLFREDTRKNKEKESDEAQIEKLEISSRMTPEIEAMIENISEKLKEAEKLCKRQICPDEEKRFDCIKLQTILRWCVNAVFYLAMKARRSKSLCPYILQRIALYQQLLKQLDTSQRSCEMLSPNETSVEMDETEINSSEDEAKDEKSNEDLLQNEKRAINRQIEKNRGLTPHRKKEYKNPRTKHRLKYRKALIRRRGQVREVRHELYRYGGESSGINIGVTKSIKFK